MSIRHSFIASSLILAPIVTLSFGSAAFAGSENQNIFLSGTVDPIISLTSTSTAAASTLPLSTAGAQTIKIADLAVTTNAGAVNLTATSTNNGQLVNIGDPQRTVSYKLDVVGDGGQAVNFSDLNNFYRLVEGDLDLYIQVNNPSTPYAGTYMDTLTVTVSDGN